MDENKQIIISLGEYRRFRAIEKKIANIDKDCLIKYYTYRGMGGYGFDYWTIISKDKAIEELDNKAKKIQKEKSNLSNKLSKIKDIIWPWPNNKINRATRTGYTQILSICENKD